MPKIIAHRGNMAGPSQYENDPFYLREATDAGFDIEVDVWMITGKFWTGHDKPEYAISVDFLNHMNQLAWFHAKNIPAMRSLMELKLTNVFWIQNDDIALTSSGYLWTRVGKLLTPSSIAVIPEDDRDWDVSVAHGLCTDYASAYAERIQTGARK